MTMLLVPNLVKCQETGPILITGHTGFKGSWLGLLFNALGIQTIGLSLPPLEGSLYTKISKSHISEEFFVDIRDASTILKIIDKVKPSVIFHMAAQPLVLNSYKNPVETFATNVMGTANLLNSFVRLPQARLFVGITTDKVYENHNHGKKFKEDDPMFGKDPYSASKVGTENVLSAWRQISKIDHGPKIISVRAGNVIGGGDFAENRIIPDIIRGIINKESVEIRNPNSTRPWQHVLDPLIGYLKAAEYTLENGEYSAFNFGPSSDSLPVEKLVEIVKSTWPDQLPPFTFSSSAQEVEAVTLQLDSMRSHEMLDWEPFWSQEGAIEDTFKWWNAVISNKSSPLQACIENIESAINGASK